MSTTTQAQDQWKFEDLYNLIMERIEPELCTYNLDDIDAFYEEETKQQKTERYKHYARALDMFWSSVTELIDLTAMDLKEFETTFFTELKKNISSKEEQDLSDLSISIDDA